MGGDGATRPSAPPRSSRALGADQAWFNLGDLDLATHLLRTDLLAGGATMSEVTARIARRFGVTARLLPVTDDRVATRIDAVDAVTGEQLDLHFQEYWVGRRAADHVKGVRYEGARRHGPRPASSRRSAAPTRSLFCPSNPVVSIGPILAVPGIREAVAARRAGRGGGERHRRRRARRRAWPIG